MALIYKVLFLSISTFETPPSIDFLGLFLEAVWKLKLSNQGLEV